MRASRLVILTLAGALLAGCGAAAAGQPSAPRDALIIGCDEFVAARGANAERVIERTVTAAVGEAFTVTLCSNASTGFAWEQPTFAGPAIVDLVDRQSVAASGTLVGSAGSERFTFRITSAGTTTIGLAYSQPWDGGTKQAWTVRLTVIGS